MKVQPQYLLFIEKDFANKASKFNIKVIDKFCMGYEAKNEFSLWIKNSEPLLVLNLLRMLSFIVHCGDEVDRNNQSLGLSLIKSSTVALNIVAALLSIFD